MTCLTNMFLFLQFGNMKKDDYFTVIILKRRNLCQTLLFRSCILHDIC